MRPAPLSLPAVDLATPREEFLRAVQDGLGQARKTLPCKFFYDEVGSRLFERICELPEYYLPRAELAIMRRYADEMAALLGADCSLIEYGSGSSHKIRLLLDHLRAPAAYLPIDISREHLLASTARLSESYPQLRVLPICADYTGPFSLPDELPVICRRAAYFPGSTIGNFEPREACRFLRRIRETCGRGSGLLIGVDLKKDPRLLHAAYNDSAGVTAAFNLNLLDRINRELGGDFALEGFGHYAFYNPRLGRIEMHLVSLADQKLQLADTVINFREGETVFTESSYKYTVEEFLRLAADAGYRTERTWLDDGRLFSIHYLKAEV